MEQRKPMKKTLLALVLTLFAGAALAGPTPIPLVGTPVPTPTGTPAAIPAAQSIQSVKATTNTAGDLWYFYMTGTTAGEWVVEVSFDGGTTYSPVHTFKYLGEVWSAPTCGVCQFRARNTNAPAPADAVIWSTMASSAISAVTHSPTATFTATATATATFTARPTATNTYTQTPVNTMTPTVTPTGTRTATAVPPTATNTPVLNPTSTPTWTPQASTPTPTQTFTPVPPTATATKTFTPTATATPTP